MSGSVAGTLRAVPSVLKFRQPVKKVESVVDGVFDDSIVSRMVRDVQRVFRHIVGGWRVSVRASAAGAGGWSWRAPPGGTSGCSRRRPRALRRGCRKARDVPARLQHAVASAACESLTRVPVDDPIALFSALFERAARECAEPDAMVLSTVDADGRPSARYVLLKGVDDRGFVFYTNVESRKARAMAAHPLRGADVLLAAGDAGAHRGRRRAGVGRRRRRLLRDAAARFPDWRVGVGCRARSWRRARRSTRGSSEIEKRFANAPVTRPPFWIGYRVVASFDRVLDARSRPAPRRVSSSAATTVRGRARSSFPSRPSP